MERREQWSGRSYQQSHSDGGDLIWGKLGSEEGTKKLSHQSCACTRGLYHQLHSVFHMNVYFLVEAECFLRSYTYWVYICYFHSRKPTGSINTLFKIINRYPGRQENTMMIISKELFKRKVRSTRTILQAIFHWRTLAISMILCSIFLECSYIWGIFQSHVLIKRFFIKRV